MLVEAQSWWSDHLRTPGSTVTAVWTGSVPVGDRASGRSGFSVSNRGAGRGLEGEMGKEMMSVRRPGAGAMNLR